jgi:rhamnosyl/mannosyltransferase
MKDIDAKLIIIGDGPWRFKLKLLAGFLGLGNKILWLGDISDESLPIYYHACDLFVLPSCSVAESFGLVILEAHASGKPVVSTDLPTGVTFTNLHQETGLVVPPRDSVALAKAINYLLNSKELRRRYGRNARKRVEREFTKEIMTKKFLTLYNIISYKSVVIS